MIFKINSLFVFLSLLFVASCDDNNAKKQVVELSCGQCQFGLITQKGCDLAVRIDGESYFVDGANIDDFGDAHDKDTGFCEAIRKAEVSGELIEYRFQVTRIKLFD